MAVMVRTEIITVGIIHVIFDDVDHADVAKTVHVVMVIYNSRRIYVFKIVGVAYFVTCLPYLVYNFLGKLHGVAFPCKSCVLGSHHIQQNAVVSPVIRHMLVLAPVLSTICDEYKDVRQDISGA